MSLTNAFGVLLAAWVCSAQNSSSVGGYRDFKLDFAGGITVGIVIAVVCLIWGLFYLFVGARYPKASVASNTFLFATGGLYFLLNFFDIEPYICLIVGAVVGIISIAITLKIWRAGLFVLGGAAGFVIWLVVKALAATSFTDVVTVYVSLAATVLVAALLSIKFEKQIFIAATSLIGSFFLVQGIDALIPGHASVFSLINDTTGLVCGYDYEWCTGIYIAIFVIAFIGMIVQFKITAKFYKKRRGVKNRSDYRRKRRGKRAYAKEEEEAPRERRRYRNREEDEDRGRREERHERKHSEDAVAAPSGGKGRLQEENAELRVRVGDLERKLAHTQDKLDGVWDLTQEEKDLVTRFRVDKRENARIAKEAAAREKARQKEEQEARDAEERDRRRQEEEDERAAKKSRKSDKRERERREREREEERLRQEEEDAYAAKKSRKKTKDDPPPYKPEPEKKSKKKKGSEKKRRDSDSEDSAEG